MAITTTYRCDKCSAEQQTAEQFWQLTVTLSSVQTPHTGSHKQMQQHWCRKCVEAAHLLPPVEHTKAREELPPAPTLEELVIELIDERIAEKTGAV